MTHEREAPPAWVVLAATVVLAGVFFCVPDRVTAELRGLAGAGLRAGQLQVANLSGWCREGLVIWAAVQGRAEELRHAPGAGGRGGRGDCAWGSMLARRG